MAATTTDQRYGVSLLEVVVIALLVVLGMGTWLIADSQVALRLRDQEPDGEQIEQAHGLPMRRLELTMAQDELKALRTQHGERQAERSREAATIESLLTTYPALVPLSEEQTIGPPVARIQAYAQARIDVDASQALASALEAECERLLGQQVDLDQSLEGLADGSRERLLAEARLGATRTALTTTQARLTTEQLDLARHQATLAALVGANPVFASVRPEVLQAYVEAASRLQLAERQETIAATRVKELQDRVAALIQEISDAKQASDLQLMQDRASFASGRVAWTFAAASVISLLLFLLVLGGISLAACKVRLPLKRMLVFVAAPAVLVVLFIYQAANMAGGALAALVLLIVFAVWMRRQSSRVTGTAGAARP